MAPLPILSSVSWRYQNDRRACPRHHVEGAANSRRPGHCADRMTTRTHSRTVAFSRPFLLKGIDRTLPAGGYQVVTDEELVEGLSFAVYRRTSTMMMVPAQSHGASSVEMVTIDPRDLQAAIERDAAMERDAATDKLPGAAPLELPPHADLVRLAGES